MELKESEWAKQGRPVHTYTIPESLRDKSGLVPAKVGMVQLTAEQELLASKLGQYQLLKAQYAATKLSIVEFDGRAVNASSAEVDKFWERVDPRVRNLLLQAYQKLATPSDDEEADFLKSEEVRV